MPRDVLLIDWWRPPPPYLDDKFTKLLTHFPIQWWHEKSEYEKYIKFIIWIANMKKWGECWARETAIHYFDWDNTSTFGGK